MKKHKNRRLIYIVIIFGLLIAVSFRLISWSNIEIFISDYKAYLKSDIENQISLFESIVGGFCAGLTTFGALLITILHENKKNRETWEKEKEKERELRLWTKMPVLSLTCTSVSSVRNGEIRQEANMLQVGNGNKHLYVTMSMSNTGNGNCRNIDLEKGTCSVNQLSKDEERIIKIFFNGLASNQKEVKFDIIFSFQDDLGTEYSQLFDCHINIDERVMKIKTKKPYMGDKKR